MIQQLLIQPELVKSKLRPSQLLRSMIGKVKEGSSFYRFDNKYCAMGAMLLALGDDTTTDCCKVCDKLNISHSLHSDIVVLNDWKHYSFEQIANHLESRGL